MLHSILTINIYCIFLSDGLDIFTHPQNFDCDDSIAFWSLQFSFIDIGKLP